MDTVRAFVGCLLDLGATRRVVQLQSALKRAGEGQGLRAAWVPPPNLHITLKFLGEIDAGLAAPLGDALASVARRHAPLRLAVAGVGAFPEQGPPRVLFARLHRGSELLTALAADVDAAFADVGLAPASRPFHGHVTLARVQQSPPGLDPTLLLPPGAAADCGTGVISELALYRSDLLRSGAEYHALARHPLQVRADR